MFICAYKKTSSVIEYKLQLLRTILKEKFPEISHGSCRAHNGTLGNWWLLHIFMSPYTETNSFMLKVLVKHTTWSHFIENSAKFCSNKFFIAVVDSQFQHLTAG